MMLKMRAFDFWGEDGYPNRLLLDRVVGVLGNEAHGLEAGHGGVGLGLLLVVDGHAGHKLTAVHRHLE